MAREAVDILASALPENHYATAAARCRVGEGLALQRRDGEAEPVMARALETLRASDVAPERLVDECSAAPQELRRRRTP
jgi:hypothetical protein